MSRELEYKICRDRFNKPLVELVSPLGNNQHLSADALRSLAARLLEIATQAEACDTGRGYSPLKNTVTY